MSKKKMIQKEKRELKEYQDTLAREEIAFKKCTKEEIEQLIREGRIKPDEAGNWFYD